MTELIKGSSRFWSKILAKTRMHPLEEPDSGRMFWRYGWRSLSQVHTWHEVGLSLLQVRPAILKQILAICRWRVQIEGITVKGALSDLYMCGCQRLYFM